MAASNNEATTVVNTADSVADDEDDDDDYNEYGQEERPPPDTAWRRDPDQSFSDWKIRVICREKTDEDAAVKEGEEDSSVAAAAEEEKKNSKSKTKQPPPPPPPKDYHVHRVFLASGPRKSEYFTTLFSTQAATMEQEQQMTVLTLPETACRAFDQFLDFVYGGKDALQMSSSTAVALHYLADYMQVEQLHEVTRQFIEVHLAERNVHVYCSQALYYNVDWLVEQCIQWAANSPQLLGGDIEAVDVSIPHHIPEPGTAPDRAAQQVLAMLPPAQQVKLLQQSLSYSLNELKRFKRVPAQWKEIIQDTRASHLPAVVNSIMHYPLQGSCLDFGGRNCPLFYFDRDPRLGNVAHQRRTPERLMPIPSFFGATVGPTVGPTFGANAGPLRNPFEQHARETDDLIPPGFRFNNN